MKTIQCYKKIYILRTIIMFSLVILFSNNLIFSDENSSKNKISLSSKPSWYTVLGGQAVTKPVKTSYGFAIVSDGKLLSACSHNGEILWQEGLSQRSSPYFISGYSDSLYLVSQTGKLTMYNSTGMAVWEHQLEEMPVENLILGNDGRLFVRGSNSLICFSITGKIKWFLDTEKASSVKTSEFSDGSLLVILEKEINGCSTALRVSPYGKILEEITFTGKVTSTCSSDNGILVGFTNGEVGYINLIENKAKTIWSILPSTFNNSSNEFPVNIFSNKNSFYVCFSNHKIACVQSGKISWSIFVDAQLENIQDFYSDGQINYFITENDTICLTRKGILQKHYTYYYGESTFPFYLEPGFLVFSTPDWCINSYRIVQTTGKYKGNAAIPKNYEEKNYKIQKNYTLKECISLLQSENTSEYEQDILKKLSYEIEDIISFYYQTKEQQQRIKGQNGVLNTVETLEACGYTGLGCYTTLLSLIIENETDFSIVTSALKAAGRLCYDDGKIISAMELLSRKSNFKSNVVLQQEFCKTLYEICRFMGKPVVLDKGKDILVYLLTGTSSEEVKNFTRETMEKIIALQM